MKRNKQKEAQQEDILDEEEKEGEANKKDKPKRKESVERRKKAKELDKVTRWSGFILLIIIMMLGFLLWVSGEMKKESERSQNMIYTSPSNSIIVK